MAREVRAVFREGAAAEMTPLGGLDLRAAFHRAYRHSGLPSALEESHWAAFRDWQKAILRTHWRGLFEAFLDTIKKSASPEET